MINAFEAIKESLQIADILAFYGITVKHNKACCPLHNDKTPSFTIYRNTNSWHCFGCGVGGSVIDFVMACYGLDSLDSAKKLDEDFNLGLFQNRLSESKSYLLKEKQAQTQASNNLAETFETYINKAFSILCDYLHLLNDWKITHAPKSAEELETVNPLFVKACHQLDYIEYLIDWLCFADYEQQILFYQLYRKEVVSIATTIKQHAKGRNADQSA